MLKINQEAYAQWNQGGIFHFRNIISRLVNDGLIPKMTNLDFKNCEPCLSAISARLNFRPRNYLLLIHKRNYLLLIQRAQPHLETKKKKKNPVVECLIPIALFNEPSTRWIFYVCLTSYMLDTFINVFFLKKILLLLLTVDMLRKIGKNITNICIANLVLMKVLMTKLQAERLHTHLKSMVENLLQWQDDTNKHFKAKHLLEMIVRKCGLDTVKAVIPEEHMKIVTNIRKIEKLQPRTKSVYSRASTARLSRWSHTNIFSDVGDEDGGDSDDSLGAGTSTCRSKDASVSFSRSSLVTSGQEKQTSDSLPGDLLDHGESVPLDLLDRQKTRSALRASQPHQLRPQEIDENIEIAPHGRLIITTIKESKLNKQRDSDSDDQNNESLTLKSKNSSSSRVMPSIGFRQNKRQKTSDSGRAYKGDEYASKKASGDLKKTGKLEPYAYWPLDRKMLNTREEKRAVSRKGLANVKKLSKKLEGRSVSSALSVRGVGGLKRKQKAHKGKGRFKKK
ncbi:hypothetical protein AMTRI_Chr12g234250 [Amborella trichopoda]